MWCYIFPEVWTVWEGKKITWKRKVLFARQQEPRYATPLHQLYRLNCDQNPTRPSPCRDLLLRRPTERNVNCDTSLFIPTTSLLLFFPSLLPPRTALTPCHVGQVTQKLPPSRCFRSTNCSESPTPSPAFFSCIFIFCRPSPVSHQSGLPGTCCKLQSRRSDIVMEMREGMRAELHRFTAL